MCESATYHKQPCEFDEYETQIVLQGESKLLIHPIQSFSDKDRNI